MHVGAIEIRPPGDNQVGLLDTLRVSPAGWPNGQLPGFPTARVTDRASIDARRSQGVKQGLRKVTVH